MTLAQVSIDTPIILTVIGMLGGLFAAVVGCTWYLGTKAGTLINSNRNLAHAVDGLSQSFSSHVHESNGRDKQNQIEHAMLNRCCDSNVEAIKGVNKLVDRLEKQSDATDKKVDQHHARMAVIESRLDIRRVPPGS